MKYLFFLIFLLSACTHISIISEKDKEDLPLSGGVKEARDFFHQGQKDKARTKLISLKDASLSDTEKALKYNLLGVIAFGENNKSQAIDYLKKSALFSRVNKKLDSQVHLNLASSYYKYQRYEDGLYSLKQVNANLLSDAESNKYYRLANLLGEQFEEDQLKIQALVFSLKSVTDFGQFFNHPQALELSNLFLSLDQPARKSLLENLKYQKHFPVAFLYLKEAEGLYYEDKKNEAKKIVQTLKREFSGLEKLDDFIKGFFTYSRSSQEINTQSIGVVLPMTGPKAVFAKRVLKALDFVFKQQFSSVKVKPTLHIRDSLASGIGGAQAVRELIKQKKVALIIGGLFPDEAVGEYLEAKKSQAFFISLSPLYLAQDKKTDLLLEVSASIESQLTYIFSQKFLSKFGKKSAILYPSNVMGQAYAEAFSRYCGENNVEIKAATAFNSEDEDLREPVKNLLGLNSKEERQEEYNLLHNVYRRERRRTIRRIQTLPPITDFDWVFIPAFSHHSLQLIPAFGYFDAFNMNFIGGPTWRNHLVHTRNDSMGKVFFMGNQSSFREQNFIQRFNADYKVPAKAIEILGAEAMMLASNLLTQAVVETRDEFKALIKSQNQLEGLSASWKNHQGLWIRSLSLLKNTGEQIEEILSF